MSRSENKKSISVLTIGDPHFKENNAEQTRAMVESIINTAREKKPDLIVCLGDILDRHARLHTDPLCDAIGFFKRLKDIAPLRILIGNHDRRNNSDFLTDRHPFTAISDEWSNTLVADKVISETVNGHLLIYVPYVPPGRFKESLNLGVGQDISALYKPPKVEKRLYNRSILEKLHQDFISQEGIDLYQFIYDNLKDEPYMPDDYENTQSSTTSNTQTSESTMESENIESSVVAESSESTQPDKSGYITIKDFINQENPAEDNGECEEDEQAWWRNASFIFAHQEFKGGKMGAIISEIGDVWSTNYPFVGSGHLHDHHYPQANICYTGTPIQHGFADTIDKTISIFHINDESKVEEERIDLGLIKRKCFKLQIHQILNWVPPPGFIIKVKLVASEGEIKALKALSKIEQLRAAGITVIIKNNKDNRNESDIDIAQIRPVKNFLAALLDDVHQSPKHKDNMLECYKEIFEISTIIRKPKIVLGASSSKMTLRKVAVKPEQTLESDEAEQTAEPEKIVVRTPIRRITPIKAVVAKKIEKDTIEAAEEAVKQVIEAVEVVVERVIEAVEQAPVKRVLKIAPKIVAKPVIKPVAKVIARPVASIAASSSTAAANPVPLKKPMTMTVRRPALVLKPKT